MSDEAFREFHLSGKQLVFLFMTATVIAVGIFLCGVMVGRGVPVPRTEVTVISEGEIDPTAPSVTPLPEATGPTTLKPTGFEERLDDPEDPPVEEIAAEPRVETPVPQVETTVANAPRAAAAAAPKAAGVQAAKEAPLPAAPSGSGFVVQVAAVKARAEAETIRRRLSGKGYPAFITTASPGGATMFRVRVGKYADRQEAESIKAKLEREERFKPWVTR